MKTHKIFNAITGETIERPYSDIEMAEYEEAQKQRKIEEANAEAKAAAKAALLERLGITEEEARLLLGGN